MQTADETVVRQPDRRRLRLYGPAYLALLCVSLAPVFLTAILPLSDYSNHLARMNILVNLYRSPALQQFYEIHWSVLPNLSMDVVVPFIATFLPLEIAGKVFVGLMLTLISTGTLALHFALHRTLSPWPLIVFLFLYNLVVILGLMNYLFALGLALWGLAGWIFLRDKPLALRIPVFCTFALLLLFAHLSAFSFYGLVLFCYEAHESRQSTNRDRRRDWLCTLAQFVAPAVLFLASRTSEHAALTSHWDAFQKAVALFALVWNYNFVLDEVTCVAAVQLVILGFISRRLVVARPMRLALIVLGVVFVAMPSTILSSNYADYRLLPALACLFIASTSFTAPGRYLGGFLVAGFTALFLVRMAVLEYNWHEKDALYAEYLQAIEHLPIGCRLFSGFAYASQLNNPPESGPNLNEELVSAYAVIRRSAFVPSLFADPYVHPISFTAPYRDLAQRASRLSYYGGESPDWTKLKESYDYWLVARESLFNSPLPSGIEVVFGGRDFRLYRVSSAGKGGELRSRECSSSRE